jgi:hypothetical protein
VWHREAERTGTQNPDVSAEAVSSWIKDEKTELAILFGDGLAKRNWAFRLILTSNGCIGRSKPSVREGDIIRIILGCAVPMALRPIESHYELIWEAYVPGIMHGEAMRLLKEGRQEGVARV